MKLNLTFKYWLFPFALCLAMGISLLLGQDTNWDLRNYHYYNPHAWLTGRLSLDIAPAQLQSYFSPISDIPYYLMVKAGYPSWLVGSILAIPAAIALFFIGMVSVAVLPPSTGRVPLMSILILSITGASGFSVIGSTQSEWHVTALFSAALWILVQYGIVDDAFKNKKLISIWFTSGLLGGLAVGLKLTGGVYAIALACMCFSITGHWIARLKNTLILACGGIVGFSVTFLPWGLEMWSRFNNPFFPIFNHIFQSPMTEFISYADTRYATKSIWELVSLPFRLMIENVSVVSEMHLRDWRLALGLPSVAWMAFATSRFSTERSAVWRPLFVFCFVSYVIWASFSSIYRYAETLELMMPLAIVAVTLSIFQKWQKTAVLVVTVILMLTTRCPDLGRLPHGDNAVVSSIPDLPPGSMVIIATLEPVAYVVPSLPPEIPVIALVNNFMRPGAWRTQLQIQATQRAMNHDGPLWLLSKNASADEKFYEGTPVKDMLKEIGLWKGSACKSIQSGLDGDQLTLCKLNKY